MSGCRRVFFRDSIWTPGNESRDTDTVFWDFFFEGLVSW